MSTGPGGTAPYGGDPYGSGSYGSGSSSNAPYGSGSYGSGSSSNDPYGSVSSGSDPYAPAPSAEDPLSADGFGPQFGVVEAAPYAPGPGHRTVPVQPPPAQSSAAITGFVLGLLALTLCAGFTAPVGLFFAAKGMKETSPMSAQPVGGRGLAIAGLVTSLIGIVPFLIMLFYVVVMVVAVVLGAIES